MNEREPTITYRKSRNTRAAKVWESAVLHNAMVHASEIKYNIEKLATEENLPLSELKHTVIESELLWYLADTYLDAYKMLMKEGLIKSGNIHKISPTLN